jgi:hypothetical protein
MMKLRSFFIPMFLLLFVPLAAEVITIQLESEPVAFSDRVATVEGFGKLQVPGTPILPAKSVLIALPPGSRILSVDVHLNEPEYLESRELEIVLPNLPLSGDHFATANAVERWKRNSALFKTVREPFPLQPVYHSKVSHFWDIPFVRISYFPLICREHSLNFYSSARVNVHYTGANRKSNIPEWVEQKASDLFYNWEQMKTYYASAARDDSFDYVILTHDSLFNAFDSLTDWKTSIGFNVKLMSIDTVFAQYPGTDNADRIRNFLIDKYQSWGIHYLLLGGNIDMIPMKLCFPDSEHNFDTPTDYYFAELTDNWDSDNDGFYGEYEQDSIGFVPEVMVGRISYNSGTMIRKIAKKTVNCEKDTGPWKTNALLLGAFSNFENEDHTGWPSCDGAVLMENVKDSLLSGWTYTRMYEKEGLCPSVYPCDFSLTHSNVVSVWSSGSYVITNWSGHGSSAGAYRKIWAWDDGDSVPESEEISWDAFIHEGDAMYLDDSHPSIIFSASCSNAEGLDNLARAFIGNGASGIVAATTYGWYTPGWEDPSDGNLMSLNYYFYYYIIAEGKKVGDALFDSKLYYFTYLYFPDPWAGDPEWTPQQNMLDYTLFGDPSLERAGVGVAEEPVPGISIRLFRIYPNPIRFGAFIEYGIPNGGMVDISLYNVAGQKLATIHQGSEDAGYHRVILDRKDFSGGIYFIKLQISSATGTVTGKRKIVLF